MGLDVYLYRYENLEVYKKLQEDYKRQSEAIWKRIENGRKYEELTEEEKNKSSIETDKLEKDLEIPKYEGQEIEITSTKYPEHYFKIGYFRSSYNEGGFNRVVGNSIGTDLYSIFEAGDEYIFVPDWDVAKVRTEKMIKEFSEYLKEGMYRVIEISSFHTKVNSSKEALGVFLEEFKSSKEQKVCFENYSNMKGEFFLKGTEISAVINGNSGVYLIYKDEGMKWYLEALEIVLETIEYVLSQPDKDKYALHWSA